MSTIVPQMLSQVKEKINYFTRLIDRSQSNNIKKIIFLDKRHYMVIVAHLQPVANDHVSCMHYISTSMHMFRGQPLDMQKMKALGRTRNQCPRVQSGRAS